MDDTKREIYVVFRNNEPIYTSFEEYDARACLSDNLDVGETAESKGLRIVMYHCGHEVT